VTSKSPLVVTFSRLWYQDLRGLRRSLWLDLPVSRSQVHLTSAAVKGLPSCHLTPSRNGKVSSVPSSLHDQPVARSGTIDCMSFCLACWSNMTRLLTNPMVARAGTASASSCIDRLGGESRACTRKIPPCFCASAAAEPKITPSNAPTITILRRLLVIPRSSHFIFGAPPSRLRPRLNLASAFLFRSSRSVMTITYHEMGSSSAGTWGHLNVGPPTTPVKRSPLPHFDERSRVGWNRRPRWTG
jgi:hypothetical protein